MLKDLFGASGELYETYPQISSLLHELRFEDSVGIVYPGVHRNELDPCEGLN